MTYIVIVGALIIGSLIFYNVNKQSNASEEKTEIIESLQHNKENMIQDTFPAQHTYAITGQGKINGVIFSMAGIKKKDVDGQMIDHIVIDVDEFIYAKEGDIVTLGENLKIKILKLTNPPHPSIGKVYFDVID